MKLASARLPAMFTVPVADILNTEVPFAVLVAYVSKLTRSAFDELGLRMPKNVPLALPFEIGFGPSAKRESVAVATGVEETKKEVFAAFWKAKELLNAEALVQMGIF